MQKNIHVIEGITHIEDLPTPQFISVIRNISKMIATEKLDGANLWFGLNDEGRLFTSRSGKKRSAENVYNEADYSRVSASNGFRAAHAALAAKEDDIKKYLRNGDTVEIEVLYGRQPNAVTYGADGKNYIAILRGVDGTPDSTAEQLSNMLAGSQVSVNVQIIDTTDGETLNSIDANLDFRFVTIQQIDSKHLNSVNVESQLSKLEKYLNAKANVENADITNAELIATSLGSVDKDNRPQFKLAKVGAISHIMTAFKLPIKKEILNKFVKQIKPSLSADDLADGEDNGIEGVVLRDPVTGEQVKIVDKDGFSTINQFNFAVRASISGPVRSVDADAPLESRGGVVGSLKINIADLLGNKDLARPQMGKKLFAAVRGKSAEDTMRNVVAGLKGGENFRATKRKVLAMISATNVELAKSLANFKDSYEEYQLVLKDGKKVGLSPEVIKRTLLAFAESKKNIVTMFNSVKQTKSLAQLAVIFWGSYAIAIHKEPDETVQEAINETLLLEKKFQTDKKLYTNKDAWTLINTYLATVLLTALMYKTKDTQGLRMLKDKAHYRMTSWTPIMSPLNFWGYPIWRFSQPVVKKLIGRKTSLELSRIIKKIPASHSRMLHMDLSFGSDVPINWNDHYKTLKQLQWFPGLKTDRINKLLVGVFKYEELNLTQKIKTLNALYFYAQQFVSSSPLILRLKAEQHNVLVNANGENYLMTEQLSLLKRIIEDADNLSAGITAPGSPGSNAQDNSFSGSSVSTDSINSVSIASKDMRVGNGLRIIKRVRNPNLVKNKFKRPTKEKEAQ